MELIVERAAALDVGKEQVVACIRVPDPGGVGRGRGRGRRRQEVRTYPTFTSSLEALADWLQTEAVTQVVMEATGQYWKPIWQVLEERGLELLLVNARHVKLLPGRKTPSMSSSGGGGSLLGQPLGGPMLDRVVGQVVDPAAPDHPDPGASKDAGGVGVVVAAGDGVGVDLGGPGAGQPGVVREGRHGVAEALVARPAERHGGVLAGLAGDRHDAGQGGDGLGPVVGVAAVAHSASIWAALI